MKKLADRAWLGCLLVLLREVGAFQSAVAQSVATDTISLEERAPRDVASMEQWAVGCGVQKAEGLQFYSTTGDGLDVAAMTTQDLPANSPALFVPSGMILSSSQAQQELGRVEGAENLLNRLNEGDNIPQFYLLLKILKEYEMGSQSPYYYWLNSLPRYFSNGSQMTHYCSQCLPPLVGKLASSERIRFSKFFQALRHVPFLSDQTKRSRKIAKWAFQVVYTRSVGAMDAFGDVKIAPMADMFNHGTDTEIQLSYDEQGNCYGITTYDVPAGSPLRMSYGDPTNPSFLFARYGFLDETSPATFCKIMIPNPSQQLIDMGYDHSRMLFYKDTGGVSQEVWDVLLYQILEFDPQQQQSFYQAHMSGDSETKQSFHQHYAAETSAMLLNHVDTFLSELDTLQAKAELRRRRKSSKHPRVPLIMSHNQFVRNTFLKVREQLQYR
ncbi:M protein repeat protein [Seminavis robusta]|uniref:M protein repeat protein n=1 Tax=Seminavis robusta TaxID=568900 RepID=A0A9N8E2B1_9STRA|nr:M protein repeat protein [Seminavis robusta]|eukprot:Sro578_g169830.1 M protein repeat protein (440) ;mRNA; f:23922-25339